MRNLFSRPARPAPDDAGWPVRAHLVAGLVYPFWYLLTPAGASDAWWTWSAVSLTYLVPVACASQVPLVRRMLSGMFPGPWLCTLQVYVLAWLNDMHIFYTVGSVMAVLAVSAMITSTAGLASYGVFVSVLGLGLFILDPDPVKAACWGGVLPVIVIAYQRLSMSLTQAQLARNYRDQLERDVTERTRELSHANQQLRDAIEARTRLEEELRIQHKIEAVGRLAGGVAHDFNNLLTTIGVYADLLREGLPEGSPLRSEVDQIQQAQREAASLTQQLMTLGRRSHVELKVLDLNEVVSGMLSLLRHVLSGHEVVFALGDGRHPISANVEQLQQIVLNLALNARDAMVEPGRLTLETARQSRDALAESLGMELDSQEFVRLAVTDTGAGMSPETRDRAFDPFFSTKPPGRGSGLGLSIVHGIVSQAGGYVRLTSEPGHGARFELYWPVATELRASEQVRSRPVAAPPSASILLVDDEAALRDALQRILTTAGYRVTEASDARQALQAALDADANFDLVITDVVMPQMSGLELAERLAETRPAAKILLISGRLSERALGSWDGRIAFLAKPFAPKDLLQKVGDVLGYVPIPS